MPRWKKVLMGITLIAVTIMPAFGQPTSAQPAEPIVLSPAELAQDFAVFRTALEEAHPGIYRYTSKADFDALFSSIAARL
ncbi:MAG: hypothetical protein MUF84_16795, partial [Anaerolineae bacterium]|nr:hypothetical protein [Anaerolineae bacterium]